jgi:gamma-glutamylcyclotransferase (GGCT)/AIG2-like uncharacterized protein YtfP
MDRVMDAMFVYGTLKRGQDNHHWLRGARFQGRRRLVGGRLHDLGPYPMAVRGTGVIHGEVYAVSDDDLERLDGLEDVPSLYQRHRLPLDDGSLAWTYLGRPEQVRDLPLVPFADWDTTPVFHCGQILHHEPGLQAICPPGRPGQLNHLAQEHLASLGRLAIVKVALQEAPHICFDALSP